jgi:hypothetical protein
LKADEILVVKANLLFPSGLASVKARLERKKRELLLFLITAAFVLSLVLGIAHLGGEIPGGTLQWEIVSYSSNPLDNYTYEVLVSLKFEPRPPTSEELEIISTEVIQKLKLEEPTWEFLPASFKILSVNPPQISFRYRLLAEV